VAEKVYGGKGLAENVIWGRGLAEKSEYHYTRRGLKLLKKPSYI